MDWPSQGTKYRQPNRECGDASDLDRSIYYTVRKNELRLGVDYTSVPPAVIIDVVGIRDPHEKKLAEAT